MAVLPVVLIANPMVRSSDPKTIFSIVIMNILPEVAAVLFATKLDLLPKFL
jgi:hypothetical protein